MKLQVNVMNRINKKTFLGMPEKSIHIHFLFNDVHKIILRIKAIEML